ncbi:MAG: DUF5110 domain-containing protein [Verrucomicrobia bacterium]|nr:DUF5110 domain-containing protein [Verrucomicrobiota bacterium]MCH8511730.1 DUF5110 domain-containing protein [Kiritimatiellia bacterium]
MSHSILPPSKNVIVFHNARFTLLTPRLLRMEWAEDRVFEDLPTLTVSNRNTPKVPFKKEVQDQTLTLETGELTLVYMENGKPFNRGNLEIRFQLNGKTVKWFPGKKDRQNLKGTAKTLDGIDGNKKQTWVPVEEKNPNLPIVGYSPDKKWIYQGEHKTPLELCDGLISRSGWAVVDDSTSCVLDPALCDWQPWVRERAPGERRDLYFLGHGHDYKGAVRDAAQIFGAQPLPPRYALGYWYSRYWAYTDKELKQLVEDFDTMNLPLDVLVIDMDWHKLGWTGYSWDPDFFPDPKELLQWLKDRGLKITLNLHPADGVFDFEDAFPAMLKEMGLKRDDLPDLEERYHRLYELLGLDPLKAKRIPLDINDPNYMRAYFRCLHHPMERDGVDFWWMDWQQGRAGSRLPNLDTLPWINELHWQDQVHNRPDQRPINFSRFGGIGAGRMPIGFSGDTIVTWDSLAYQPEFTATSANVLYGYWSHDIGGHMRGELTPELYTRWLQLGIFSPILRTHTSKAIECERRVFHFPDPHRSVMMRVLRRRYELVPYLYREMRKCADNGLSMIRPMYYEHPEETEAYRCENQYMFGDDMIVAPVVEPLHPDDEMASASVWLPEGEWFDIERGCLLQGGQRVTIRYTLEETPVFVRPGTVIPEQTFVRRLEPGSFPEIVFRVYPGKSGKTTVYEDDGVSNDWQKGLHAEICFRHKKKGNVRTLRISRPKGQKKPKFKGFQAKRPVKIIFEGVAPPKSAEGLDWRYDGDTASLHLDAGVLDLNKSHAFTLVEAGGKVQKKALGLKGLMTRLEKVRALNCIVSPCRPIHADERLAVRVAQTGNRVSLHPETFSKKLDQMAADLNRLPKALDAYIDAYAELEKNTGNSQQNQIKILKRASGILKATLKEMAPTKG